MTWVATLAGRNTSTLGESVHHSAPSLSSPHIFPSSSSSSSRTGGGRSSQSAISNISILSSPRPLPDLGTQCSVPHCCWYQLLSIITMEPDTNYEMRWWWVNNLDHKKGWTLRQKELRTRVASEVMWNTAKNSSVTTEYFQNASLLYFMFSNLIKIWKLRGWENIS